MAGQNKLSIILSPEFSRESLETLRRDVAGVLHSLPANVDLSINGGAISINNDLDVILERFRGVLDATASDMKYSFSEATKAACNAAKDSMDAMIFAAEHASSSIINAAVDRAGRISSKITADVQEYKRLISEASGINTRLYEIGDKPGVNSAAVNDAMLQMGYFAQGGYVPSTPGGRHVVVAEGGEGEYIVPESKVEEFVRERGRGGVNDAMRNATQTHDGGASQGITVIVDMNDANAVHGAYNSQYTNTSSSQTRGSDDSAVAVEEDVSGSSQRPLSRREREMAVDRADRISDLMGSKYAAEYSDIRDKNQEKAYEFYKDLMYSRDNNVDFESMRDPLHTMLTDIAGNEGTEAAVRYGSVKKQSLSRAYEMYQEMVSGRGKEKIQDDEAGELDLSGDFDKVMDGDLMKVPVQRNRSQEVEFADLAGLADVDPGGGYDPLSNRLSKTFESMKGGMSNAYGFASDKWSGFKSAITSDFGNTPEEREQNVKKSTSQVKAIDSVVQGGFNIVTGLMKFSVNLSQSIFKKIKEASPFLQTIEELFNTAVNILLMPLGNLISEEILPMLLDFIEDATGVWDVVESALSGSDGGNLGNVFNKVIEYAITSISGFIKNIGSTLKEQGGFMGAIGTMLEAIGNFLEDDGLTILSLMLEVGAFVLSNIKELLSVAVAFAVTHQGLMLTLIATTAAAGAVISGGASVVAAAAIGTFASVALGASAGANTYNELSGNFGALDMGIIGTRAIGNISGQIGEAVKLAEGGHVEPLPGGTRAIIGEGGEAEDVVPESKKLGYALSVISDHSNSYGANASNSYSSSRSDYSEYNSVSNGNNITLTINGATTDEIKEYIREYVDGQIRQSRYRSGF